MKKLFLHVGYPKTATTSLQRNVFSQLPGSEWEVISPEQEGCVVPHLDVKKALRGDGDALLSVIAESRKPWLISIEGLIFDCMRDWGPGGKRFAPRNWQQTVAGIDAFRKANNFDDIKILIWLRRQDELIHSVYAQSYRNFFSRVSGLDTLTAYVDRIVKAETADAPLVNAYHFQNILQPLIEQFGRQNINIFFYESLAENGAREIAELSRLIGFEFATELQKANVRKAGANVKMSREATLWDLLLRIKQRYLSGVRLPEGLKKTAARISSKVVFGGGSAIVLSDSDRERLLTHFRQANVACADKLELQLPSSYM